MPVGVIVGIAIVVVALAIWLGVKKHKARLRAEELVVQTNAREEELWRREQQSKAARDAIRPTAPKPVRGMHPTRLDDEDEEDFQGPYSGRESARKVGGYPSSSRPVDDLLNPANPLSPISPLNPITDPAGLYDSDMTTEHHDDRTTDSTSDSSSSDSSDTPSDPPSNDAGSDSYASDGTSYGSDAASSGSDGGSFDPGS